VVVSRVIPSDGLTSFTVAPGITALAGSTTVPRMFATSMVWAPIIAAKNKKQHNETGEWLTKLTLFIDSDTSHGQVTTDNTGTTATTTSGRRDANYWRVARTNSERL